MRAMLSFRSVFSLHLPLLCVVLCSPIKRRKETFFSLPHLDFIKLLSYVFAITALFFFKHPASPPFLLLLSS
uniref:Secreted protein n=1 Tax=Ixodes ricinus TaxID=34613 RepID=A0A6B0TXX5_IXORI